MSQSLDLYLDASKFGGGDCLLELKTSSPRAGEVKLVAMDKVPVRVFHRTVTAGSSTTTAFNIAPDTLGFDSDLIPAAQMSTFAAAGSDDDLHQAATLDLTTLSAELIATLAADGEADVHIGLYTTNGSTRQLTYRFVARIYAALSASSGIAAGITITQPGGSGTPFIISGPGRSQEV